MTIDVRTLITMLGIASVVQIIAIFFQFSINRSYRGIGWWLIGFISVAVGSALLTLRESIPNEFLAIVFPNLLLIWGPLSFYIGIMRFLEKKENRIFIYVFLAFATILFILARNDMTMRTVAISAALTVTAFFITWNLFTIKPSSLSESTRFTAFLFLIYGAFSPSGQLIPQSTLRLTTSLMPQFWKFLLLLQLLFLGSF